MFLILRIAKKIDQQLIKLRIIFRGLAFLASSLRVRAYGHPRILQRVAISGDGEFHFSGEVILGVIDSPGFKRGEMYLEARKPSAKILIRDGSCIHNDIALICRSTSIEIAEDVLIGCRSSIYDSDFHVLDVDGRLTKEPSDLPVKVERNVFIGSGVTILKGVTIGENSVIGNGSIVTKDVPANYMAAGVPAKLIKRLEINV